MAMWYKHKFIRDKIKIRIIVMCSSTSFLLTDGYMGARWWGMGVV